MKYNPRFRFILFNLKLFGENVTIQGFTVSYQVMQFQYKPTVIGQFLHCPLFYKRAFHHLLQSLKFLSWSDF